MAKGKEGGGVDRPSLLARWRERASLNLTRAGALLRDLRVPMPPPARVVFHPEYVDFPLEAGPRHAFDVRRPARILEKLQRAALLSRNQVLSPEPIQRVDLELTHTPAFIDEICAPRRLVELLHLRPDQVLVDNPILAFLRQAGGTLLAAESAVRSGVLTFNLGGGFHHAQRDRAEGFCPINDVAVAIEVLRKRRQLARRVLVVDLDYHHGNGTALIFSRDEDVFTLSVHGQSWAEIDGKRNNLDVELPAGTGDEAYLEAVRGALATALETFRPDLTFYLAGADPFIEDRLGDFRIGEAALLARDLHVWHEIERRKIPLVVLLAGGYGPLAWTIPYNFIFSVLTGSPIRERYRPSNVAAEYRRIHGQLSVDQLVADSAEITTEDVLRAFEKRESGRFLDFYSRQGLEIALERYGFLSMLRDRGFEDLRLAIDTSDRTRHRMRLHFGGKQDVAHQLIDLVAAIRTLDLASDGSAGRPGGPAAVELAPAGEPSSDCRVLSIEWLCMQNPREAFSLERPSLPGQRYPGLGLSRWVVELLRMMAIRLECEGLSNSPDHYHNAYLYAKVMRYLDPADEGLLQALRRDLRALPLLDATKLVDEGRVVCVESGETFRWQGRTQLLPISGRLRAFLDRDAYRLAVERHREMLHFRVTEG